MLDRAPLPSSPSTATDLADLERLLEANRPTAVKAVVIEELSSAHLEIEDDGDDDAEDAIDVTATVQGVPTPVVPEAPKTSPVPIAAIAPIAPIAPVAEDQASFTQPFRREMHGPAPMAEDRANYTQPFRRPSSIAPVAMDVAPARPVPARPDTTLPIARLTARQAETVITRLPPKLNIVPWVIASSIIGLFLAGGGIVAAVAYTSTSP